MANRVNVELAFTANTQQAQQEFQKLKNTLSSLSSLSGVKVTENMSQDILKASQAAGELQQKLQAATNVNTGSLNLNKFALELKKSGTSVTEYRNQLLKLGPTGQQAFQQLTNSIIRANSGIGITNQAIMKLGTTLANTARWQLSSSLLYGFTGAIQNAITYVSDLNNSLNDIRIVTGYNIDRMKDFAAEANKAAKALSTTTNEYAKASLIYFQQGLNDEEVKARTDITIKMANVTSESAETVSDQMTAVWNNFYDGSKSLEHYADVLTALGAATASSTDEISQGLEKFAAIANSIGLSYEYAASALATVTATTRQSADTVGTAFKTLFARLESLELGETLDDGTSMTKYSQALATVGVSIKDANGQLRDMDGILSDLGARWGTLTRDQQVALAQTVGGMRQYNQLVALMDNWEFFQENLNTSLTSTGTLEEQSEIYAESWEAASNRVKASAEEIYSALLNDEFFIDLTNVFSSMLDYVKLLTDSFGGMKGILMLVSSAMLNAFGPKVSSFLDGTIAKVGMVASNIKAKFTGGISSEERIRNEAILSRREMQGGTTPTEIKQNQIFNQETERISAFWENADNMTEAQRSDIQQKMDQAKNLGDKVIGLTGQEDEIRSKYNKVRAEREALQEDEGYKVAKQEAKEAKSVAQEAKRIESAARSKYDKAVEERDDLITSGASKEEIVGATKKVTEAETALSKARNNTVKATNRSETATENLKKKTKEINAKINEEEGLQDKLTETTEQRTSAEKELDAQHKATMSTIDSASTKYVRLSERITAGASAAMSLGFAISSLKGMADIWNDEDATTFEKITSTMTTMGFVIPSLMSGLQNLSIAAYQNTQATKTKMAMDQLALYGIRDITEATNEEALVALLRSKGYKGEALDQAKDIALKKLQKKGIEANTKATEKDTLVKLSNAAAMQMQLIPLLAITAAIAILVVGIALMIKEQQNYEKAAQAANKTHEAAVENVTKLSDGYKELKTSIDKLSDSYKAIDKMITGTEAWKEAVKEVNKEARELIKEYNLIEGIDYKIDPRSPVAAIYEITQEGYDKILNTAEAELNEAVAFETITELSKLRSQIQLENDKARKEITLEIDKPETIAIDYFQNLTETTFKELIKKYDNGQINQEKDILDFWPDYENYHLKNYDEIISKLKENSERLKENSNELKDLNAELIEDKNLNNSLYENHYNRSALNILMAGDIAGNLGEDGRHNKIKTEVEKLWGGGGGLNQAFWKQYLIHVLGENEKDIDDNNKGKKYAIRNRGGSKVTIEVYDDDEKAWKPISGKRRHLSEEDAEQQLIEAKLAKLDDEALTTYNKFFKTYEAIISNDLKIASRSLDGTILAQQMANATVGNNYSLDDISRAGLKSISENYSAISGKNISTEQGYIKKAFNSARENWNIADSKDYGFTFQEMLDSSLEAATKDFENYNKVIISNVERFGVSAASNLDNNLQGVLNNYRNNAVEIMEVFSSTDWSLGSRRGLDNIKRALSAQGIQLNYNSQEWQNIVKYAETYYKLSLENTPALLEALTNEVMAYKTAVDKGLKFGESVDEEAYKSIIALNVELTESFVKTVDGYTYLGEELSKAIPVEKLKADLEDITEAESRAAYLRNRLANVIGTETFSTNYLNEDLQKYYNNLTNGEKTILNRAAELGDVQDNKLNEEQLQQFQAYLNLLGNPDEFALQKEEASSTLLSTASSINELNSLAKELYGDKYQAEKLYQKIFQLLTSRAIKTILEATQDEGDLKAYQEGVKKAEEAFNQSLGLGEQSLIEYREAVSKVITELNDLKRSYEEITLAEQKDKLNNFGVDYSKLDIDKNTGEILNADILLEEAASQGKDEQQLNTILKSIQESLNKIISYDNELKEYNKLINDIDTGLIKAQKELNLIDKQLEALNKLQDQYADKASDAWGADKIVALQEVNGLLDKQNKLFEKQLELLEFTNRTRKEELTKVFKDAKVNLENYIDPLTGLILGIEQIDIALTEAQRAMLEEYNDVALKILDLNIEIENNLREIEDNRLEQIEHKLEIKVTVNDFELEALERQLNRLEDKQYSGAERITKYLEKFDNLQERQSAYFENLSELTGVTVRNMSEAAAAVSNLSGKSEKEIKLITEAIKALTENVENIIEMDKQVADLVLEAFEEVSDEFDEFTTKLERLQKILNNFKNLTDIVGIGNFGVTTQLLREINAAEARIANDQLQADIEKFTLLNERYLEIEGNLKKAIENEATGDYWEKQLEEIKLLITEASENMVASWVTTVEKMKEVFESNINIMIKDFEKGIAGVYGNLDTLLEAYDQQKEVNELYVSEYEKVVQLTKLNRDIQKQIDLSDNVKIQRTLRNFQQEIVMLQQSGQKLNEYDLEYLQKKYDLRLAEIALEEAQEAKTQMRLTRNNAGNWVYTYAAKEESINNSLDQYESILIELQKMNSTQIDELQIGLINILKARGEAYQELNKLEGEAYNVRKSEIDEYYNTFLDYYQVQFAKVMNNNQLLYDNEWQAYLKMVEKEMSSNNDFQLNYKDTILGSLELGYKSFDEFIANAESNIEQLENNYLKAYKDYQIAIQNTTDLINQALGDLDPTTMGKILSDWLGAEGDELPSDSLYGHLNSYKTAFKNMVDDCNKYLGDLNSTTGTWISTVTTLLSDLTKALEEANSAYTTALELKGFLNGTGNNPPPGGDNPNNNPPPGGDNPNNNPPPGEEILTPEYNPKEDPSTGVRLGYNMLTKEFRDLTNIPAGQWDIYSTKNGWLTGIGFKDSLEESYQIAAKNIFEKLSQDYPEFLVDFESVTEEGNYGLNGIKVPFLFTRFYDYGNNNVNTNLQKGNPMFSSKVKEVLTDNEITDVEEVNGQLVFYLKNSFNYGGTKNTLYDKDLENLGLDPEKIKNILENKAIDEDKFNANLLKFINSLPTFDTGGYTGKWGTSGRLAVLHEKELILNPQDTSNLLTSMEIMRSIVSQIDLQAMAMASSSGLPTFNFGGSPQTLQQEVHIQAEFPNATNHQEIEEAFGNLVNMATQYANRKI